MKHSDKDKTTTTSIAIIAIVAALALLGVVIMVTVVTISQDAEASCILGYIRSGNKSALFTALEKSEGRCF
jgi:hypothetical protein